MNTIKKIFIVAFITGLILSAFITEGKAQSQETQIKNVEASETVLITEDGRKIEVMETFKTVKGHYIFVVSKSRGQSSVQFYSTFTNGMADYSMSTFCAMFEDRRRINESIVVTLK